MKHSKFVKVLLEEFKRAYVFTAERVKHATVKAVNALCPGTPLDARWA